MKYFVKICFIVVIFSYSHFACIDEKTGNKKAKIGQITIKGIEIILK